MGDLISRLLSSDEPSIRYRTLVHVLGRDQESAESVAAREAIRTSPRVARLLSLRASDGRIPGSTYLKYTGSHWGLTLLADMCYPPGDSVLLPLRDQVYKAWLAPHYFQLRERRGGVKTRQLSEGVPVIAGRPRICASVQGNALYSTLALGIADERAGQLAGLLLSWQWSDGGWNCDLCEKAVNASFHETLIPLRALAWHARLTGSDASRRAVERAAEVFLKRKLFRRQRDGAVMHHDFITLHYPHYWHYDVLFGLTVMAEAGCIGDPRCDEALDLLESKRLPEGGWPAEHKYYKVGEPPGGSISLVDWGGTSKTRMNEFVTVDALIVLRAAGRSID